MSQNLKISIEDTSEFEKYSKLHDAQLAKAEKQTTKVIYENTKRKYEASEVHLRTLYERVSALQREIDNLEQKQRERHVFLSNYEDSQKK